MIRCLVKTFTTSALVTGLGTPPEFNAVLHAPFTLQHQLIKLIDAEREAALEGKPATIIAKITALTEAKVIQALYRASMAGVKIRLIIRGICSLRPQMPLISENIYVCSVVGRMLEHTRVYAFHNQGQDKVYIASADWMDRNLLRRVEAATPVTQDDLKKRILDDLELYWTDNMLAWDMRADGSYARESQRREDQLTKDTVSAVGLGGQGLKCQLNSDEARDACL